MADPVNLPPGYEATYINQWDFAYTGGMQSWTVPDELAGWDLWVNIEGRGGTGGVCPSCGCTRQAVVETTSGSAPALVLLPGSPLYGAARDVQVGGAGGVGGVGSAGAGGWPNGGSGGDSVGANESGGGGGGCSEVEGMLAIPGMGGSSGAPNIGVVTPVIPIQPEPPGGPGTENAVCNARSVSGGNSFDPQAPNDRGSPWPLAYMQGYDGASGGIGGGIGGGFGQILGVKGFDGTSLGWGGGGADALTFIYDPDGAAVDLGGIGGGGGGGGASSSVGGGGGAASGDGLGDPDVYGQAPYQGSPRGSQAIPPYPDVRAGPPPVAWPAYGDSPECYFDTLQPAAELWDTYYPQVERWTYAWGGGGDGDGYLDRIDYYDDTTGDGNIRITAWYVRPLSAPEKPWIGVIGPAA